MRKRTFEPWRQPGLLSSGLSRPPWTNGRAERTYRTLKEATVKSFHDETLVALTDHLQTFVGTEQFAKHLKALRRKTPFQTIFEAWTKDPLTFRINPHHLVPELYT